MKIKPNCSKEVSTGELVDSEKFQDLQYKKHLEKLKPIKSTHIDEIPD